MASYSIVSLGGRFMLAALAVVPLGCSRPPHELAPVRGTVTLDQTPLGGGRVMFAPIAASQNREVGKPAFGQIQADGAFRLTTYREGDGAVVGEHWVTIYGPRADAQPSSAANIPRFKRLAVSKKQAVVAGQENEIHIRLTREDVARFSLNE